MSFFGCVSVQKTLPYASVSEVREEVARLLDVFDRGRGYIAAPSRSIPVGAKPENVAVLIELLQSQ